MGKNQRGESGLATLGDVLSPEMASKLLQLRNQLETKAGETAKSQMEKPASHQKQRDPVVDFKSRRKPAHPDAWNPHKRILPAQVQNPKPERHGEVKSEKVDVDQRVASGRRILEPVPSWREELPEAPASKCAPPILDAKPLPIVVTYQAYSAPSPRTNVPPGDKGEAEGRLFDLCLFDLDDTLVRTADMDELRLRGKNNESEEFKEEVRKAFHSRPRTKFYDDTIISSVKRKFPGLKLGVFTRSPRSYAQVVLGEAFSSPWWDVLIAYEDVTKTKPHGDGIHLAMSKLGIEHPSEVLIVGDGPFDIYAAYDAGAIVALDKSSWPTHRRDYVTDNWDSTNLVPDIYLERPGDLMSALDAFPRYLPELERLFLGFPGDQENIRFDKLNKFIPSDFRDGNDRVHHVYCCGRFFAHYDFLSKRKIYHKLTDSIIENKKSEVFPREWIVAIYSFIVTNNGISRALRRGSDLVVSVIPHRPDRKPRLENLLAQLKEHVSLYPFPGSDHISFEPELLAYKEGVLSQHNDKLGQLDRFANVRDHLFVKKPEAVTGWKRVLVIDDVCTTGASLFFAGRYLKNAGSGDVTSLAVSMNIGKRSI